MPIVRLRRIIRKIALTQNKFAIVDIDHINHNGLDNRKAKRQKPTMLQQENFTDNPLC
jgi:hypothetical protein